MNRIDQINAELEELDLIAEQSGLSKEEQELYNDLLQELSELAKAEAKEHFKTVKKPSSKGNFGEDLIIA